MSAFCVWPRSDLSAMAQALIAAATLAMPDAGA